MTCLRELHIALSDGTGSVMPGSLLNTCPDLERPSMRSFGPRSIGAVDQGDILTLVLTKSPGFIPPPLQEQQQLKSAYSICDPLDSTD
ncbi:hypothetical protein BGZ83_009040 [Gryganskiella cystojenkinii]|nr:hypothetical protein BGZ83_009040 [Gryganskiella cystojenkinii]